MDDLKVMKFLDTLAYLHKSIPYEFIIEEPKWPAVLPNFLLEHFSQKVEIALIFESANDLNTREVLVSLL